MAALEGLADDSEERREILDRTSRMMLHRPDLVAQLVARIIAEACDAPVIEEMTDLLGAALDTARITRENGRARGEAVLARAAEAVELAVNQRAAGTEQRLLLARIWTRCGLPAPAALEMTVDEIDTQDLQPGTDEFPDAMMEDMFQDLVSQADGDPTILHETLTEMFPAMPAELRRNAVRVTAERTEPAFTQLGTFWLLNPDPSLRITATEGLSARLAAGNLTAETTSALVTLRSWLPEDESRRRLDQLLRDAMRAGVAPASAPEPWKVHSIMATLPDGGGAQSIGIAMQSGGNRKIGMVLMKQGHGVKDAYCLPCASASEQKRVLKRLIDETGALPVTQAWLIDTLAMALGDGLAVDALPAPGLIEIAGFCNLPPLRPQHMTARSLLDGLECTPSIAKLSAQAKGRLINQSEDWIDTYAIVESWFEDSDNAHDLLDQAKSPRGLDSALWSWLETRRDWWAQIFARSAHMLEAAGQADAPSFAATAMSLLDGRPLKKIPVMLDVHETTVEAWYLDTPEMADDDFDMEPREPEPERKGELAKLLKGKKITEDWLDGFAMAVMLAPEEIGPDLWLNKIVSAAMPLTDLEMAHRLIELSMLHANAMIDQARSPAQFTDRMAKRSRKGLHGWSSGFIHGYFSFQDAWPKSKITAADNDMIELLTTAAAQSQAALDIEAIGNWISVRLPLSSMAG
ncbi:UPF0149 family protein [Paracoccus sp. (in: a-proteobacteria)]|uniref:UPF0149 family protein n=1 Tax=Paracoccus sp. TaxID=267 RepID=UPI003A882FFA